MSVTGITQARIVPVTQADPRYPKARWYGECPITGDATGGFAAAHIRVRDSSMPATLDLFSFKGAYLRAAPFPTDPEFNIFWGVMEPIMTFQMQSRYPIKLLASVSIAYAAVEPIAAPIARSLPTNSLAVVMTGPNQDTVVFTLYAWGYVWDAEADRLGGPRTNEGA